MFRAFASDDRSARSLAVELNKRKVPSPNGGEWDFSHIKNILRSGLHRHVGLRSPRRGLVPRRGRGRRAGRVTRERGDVDGFAPILVPNNHEPLVDEKTFAKVQAKLKASSKFSGGRFRKYLLSGVLRCGHCGSIMVGASQGKGRYQYYKCRRSRVSGTCNNYSIRTQFIEATLVEHFRDVWLSTNGQRALRKAITKVADEQTDDRPNLIVELQQRLESLDTQITKGKQNLLLVDPEDMPDLKRILAGWKDERSAIEKQLADERTARQRTGRRNCRRIDRRAASPRRASDVQRKPAGPRGIPTRLQERDAVLEPRWRPISLPRSRRGRTPTPVRFNGERVGSRQGSQRPEDPPRQSYDYPGQRIRSAGA